LDPANEPVVQMLTEIADILEITGTDRFRPIAYRKAARTIEALPRPVSDYIADGTISELSGIGEAISQKIEEFARKGHLEYLDNLKKEIPPGLLELLRLQDMGPRKVGRLFLELGITDIESLKKACLEHRVRDLRGFGEKSEEKILQSIRFYTESSRRFLLSEGDAVSEAIIARIASHASKVAVAGSVRRRKETVGDIDIIAVPSDSSIMDVFVSHPDISTVHSRGETKSSIQLRNGFQVDLRVVDMESFGAALLYFTGSKDHNVDLRNIAIEKDMKLNEYGLFRREGGAPVARASEEEVYAALGMQYIEPELREARGEIQAAMKGTLPSLIRAEDIRGDLHVHTDWSDGSTPLEEMVIEAVRLGYSFIGISDHSQSQRIANGLSEERMRKQIERVRRAAAKHSGTIEVLCGSEVDILQDGRLDYSREILSSLDYVIASVHSAMRMTKKEMTERLLTALSSEYVTILGHPTGRQINRREPFSFDTERVFTAAADNRIFLEINGSPERMDLNDALIMEASRYGCRFSTNTDAHHSSSLSNMKYALAMARRGWLESEGVVNTYTVRELMKALH